MLRFLGIGAQKCGTSWLHEQLRQHPALEFPSGKEMHFWNRHYALGTDWYRSIFNKPYKIQGEITPAYAILDIPKIQEIHRFYPDVRLFYSMRNPIARAWSSALMAIDRAEMTVDEASDRWFLDHFRSRGSYSRGDYAACLDAWLSVFPAEQVHLIWFDDIVAEPRSVLAGLARHLEIDPRPFGRIPDAKLHKPVFSGSDYSGQRRLVRPILLEALHVQYRPAIERLQDRLGCDLSSWLAWSGA